MSWGLHGKSTHGDWNVLYKLLYWRIKQTFINPSLEKEHFVGWLLMANYFSLSKPSVFIWKNNSFFSPDVFNFGRVQNKMHVHVSGNGLVYSLTFPFHITMYIYNFFCKWVFENILKWKQFLTLGGLCNFVEGHLRNIFCLIIFKSYKQYQMKILKYVIFISLKRMCAVWLELAQ